ncbi:MAG: TetR/AcrR family transcriptional regulator [Alphaproteobacteria bacterium]|nr:TetR/AcrR family transcriptional regulator [Alphaproteobacteria bacterium]
MNDMTRSYQLKQRGERQERTRQKIITAAMELHQTKGLAATSINDIAVRAKVGRVTVYRHFPDEAALVGACSGQYFEIHPLPDLEPWRSVQDATARLRRGLHETYAYHRATEAMMTRILAEARDHPVVAPYHAHWRRAADVIVAAWPARGRRRVLLNAAFALALDFETWRTLVRVHGLDDDQAIGLMLRLTRDRPPHSGSSNPAMVD